jgi:tyrosyl-tRNA synthetase
VLANEVTALVRGTHAATTAEQTASQTFADGGGSDLDSRPSRRGFILIDALVGIGFAVSKGEAKRLIGGGGARVDGEQIRDESHVLKCGSANGQARRSTAY